MSSHCQHLCLKGFGPGGWQPGFMPGERRSFLPALPGPAVGGPWSCTRGLRGQRLRLPAHTPLNITSVKEELISCAYVSGQLSDGIMLITTGVGHIQDLY